MSKGRQRKILGELLKEYYQEKKVREHKKSHEENRQILRA